MGLLHFLRQHEFGRLDVVNLLLAQHNVDINAAKTSGATPLFIAAQNDHLDVLNRLLEHNNININDKLTDDGATPLFIAAEKGHLDIVNALLRQSNVNVNAARIDGALRFASRLHLVTSMSLIAY